MTSIAALLYAGQKKLTQHNSSSPRLDSELLLAYVLQKNRSWLIAHRDDALTASYVNQFNTLLARRIDHEPIAYITGEKEFYGLSFTVNRATLIPRAETELLVEKIFELDSPKTILDIGTGCGAIAIALAAHSPKTHVTATDISTSALRVAKNNAKKLQVTRQISFVQSNLFANIEEKFDVIAANLPYVPITIRDRIQPDVGWEPDVALFGGEDGLDHYRNFFAQAYNYLQTGGTVWCESDPWQQNELAKIARKNGFEQFFVDYLISGYRLKKASSRALR